MERAAEGDQHKDRLKAPEFRRSYLCGQTERVSTCERREFSAGKHSLYLKDVLYSTNTNLKAGLDIRL